jgi:hypothetical protein
MINQELADLFANMHIGQNGNAGGFGVIATDKLLGEPEEYGYVVKKDETSQKMDENETISETSQKIDENTTMSETLQKIDENTTIFIKPDKETRRKDILYDMDRDLHHDKLPRKKDGLFNQNKEADKIDATQQNNFTIVDNSQNQQVIQRKVSDVNIYIFVLIYF